MKSTDWAGCFLRQNKRLQVHSVYHRTVNIYAENRILAFHPDSISLTPLSLALPLHEEEFALLANAVREKKEIQTQWTESQEVQIHIGKYSWNVGKNEVWNPKITGNLNKEQMRLALQQMREVIMRYSHLGGFSDSVFRNKNPKDDLMSGILREKITLLLDVSVRPGKMEELGRIAQEMIGLGVGLTPSGDDFVTGLLLGFLTGTFPFDEEELEDESGKTAVIADNISKGVELNEKLERESELLWILRKKNCEERGKMAETKLTLPLMMLLMVLIVITVAPALIEL